MSEKKFEKPASVAPPNRVQTDLEELIEAELDKISGGKNTVSQSLKIGSQSTGAGAGRVTFNPF